MIRTVRTPCLLLAALVLGTGCAETPPSVAGEPGICDSMATWAELPEEVGETSGLAASRQHAGIFWTHNDSGGDSAVFAIDSAGTVTGRVRIRGAMNRDWEDLSVAACEPGSDRDCLFIADIGDNRERHRHIAIFRVPEPHPRDDSVSAPAERFRASYPDGARDAEAMFITERGIHLIAKGRSHAIDLFRLPPPYSTDRTANLDHVQQLAPPPTSVSAQVTAAAVDPAHEKVVVRSYSGLRFFRIDGDTLRPLGQAADLVALGQLQGEGVDFVSGTRLVLSGEAGGREPATLGTTVCDPSRSAPSPDSLPAADD